MKHSVHVYREMKLLFTGIEADDRRQAADIAMNSETAAADTIEDCDGATIAALVDVEGDDEHEQSRTFAAPASVATPWFGSGGGMLHTVDPLGTITHIEVQGCEEDDQGNVSPVHEGEPQFWSVYVRYQPGGERGEIGGVDCIADFSSERDARLYAEQVGLLLRVPSEGAAS